MHSTFSDLTVLIKVLAIRLISNGDRVSPWRTPLLTLIGEVMKLFIRIDISKTEYSDVIS